MNKEITMGILEVALAFTVLLGAGVAAWVDTKESIVRLEEKVHAAEIDNSQFIQMLTDTHTHFTKAISESTEVLRELSISMAAVDARLGGVENQLHDIRLKM